MIIFEILANIYTNPKSDWIAGLEDSMIQPYVLQRWLIMNNNTRIQARWLDKYVFHLPPKMYLSLAWAVIPKVSKSPFVKYIKAADSTDVHDTILAKIRKHYKMSDNDMVENRSRLIKAIDSDFGKFVRYYGLSREEVMKFGKDMAYKDIMKGIVDIKGYISLKDRTTSVA